MQNYADENLELQEQILDLKKRHGEEMAESQTRHDKEMGHMKQENAELQQRVEAAEAQILRSKRGPQPETALERMARQRREMEQRKQLKY